MLHAEPTLIAAVAPRESLRLALAEAAHALPDQGPIAVFVHHNTLHALAHLPFHEAVAQAARELETYGYLTEDAYRAAYGRGRIDEADLGAALDEHLRAAPPAPRIGPLSARALYLLALRHALPVLTEAELRWQIDERGALTHMRADVSADARRRFLERSAEWLRAHDRHKAVLAAPRGDDPEAWALAALWKACQGVASHARAAAPMWARVPSERSHRDLLRAVTAADPAALVNPWLVRFIAAFLDHGMAEWPMPGRERGMLACFRDHLVSSPLPPALSRARAAVREQLRRGLDAEDTALDALATLGVDARHHAAYLTRVLLALPGWAGMVHRLEVHPEEHGEGVAPSLMELVAIRLTLDMAACSYVAEHELDFDGPLARLPAFVGGRGEPHEEPAAQEAAFRLFGVCQLAGLAAGDVLAISQKNRRAIIDRLDGFGELTRCRIWHEAYERHYREQALSALAAVRRRRDPNDEGPAPRWQLSFCFDDREESLRRHIEELEPAVETFGIAGFYGLAVDYRPLDTTRPAPLCPAGVVPSHAIHEVAAPEHETWSDALTTRRARFAKLMHFSSRGTRGLFRGLALTPLLGLAAAFPLTTRLLFPRLAQRLRGATEGLFLPAPTTRITHTRADLPSPSDLEVRDAKPRGFTVEEQVERVAVTLENMGLTRRFAPLVVALGHGSASINNPHESAYNCGACGGRQGGPNGRLFAALVNRPEVRAGLRARGIDIPDSTFFLGGMHNTADDAITLADLDLVPASHRDELAALRAVLDEARARDAHERCRRFDDVPLDLTPAEALAHVEGRVGDLSQPRPEYNHATIALCVIGRRALTRGLFLDRRCFVVAYDPSIDADGAILGRILAAAGPVGSGISLEYYFSCVDNDRYGSGTKTPHNVTGLLGVMDGHASDLRTGLTAEMVEIHEPMRLLTVVESTPERLLELMERSGATVGRDLPPFAGVGMPSRSEATPETARRQPETVGDLVTLGWMQLVCVHQDDGRMFRFDPSRGAFEPWEPGELELPEVASSIDAYRGSRDHRPFALVREPGS